MIQITVNDRASPYLHGVASAFPKELDEASRNLMRDARNLALMRNIARWSGRLANSVTPVEKTGEYQYTIRVTSPYARYVEGPTKPHFVSFKKHPLLLDWMTSKGMMPYAGLRGLMVYKSGYPAHGGGQFMVKTRNWIDRNINQYIDKAIEKSIRRS